MKTCFLNQLFTRELIFSNVHIGRRWSFSFVNNLWSEASLTVKLVRNDEKKRRGSFSVLIIPVWRSFKERTVSVSSRRENKAFNLCGAPAHHRSVGCGSESVRGHSSSLFHISLNKKTLNRHLRINAFYHYSNAARLTLICWLSDMSNFDLHSFFNFFKFCCGHLFIFLFYLKSLNNAAGEVSGLQKIFYVAHFSR